MIGASLKCDVHGWMRAPLHVFDHPYYAVTDETGRFRIDGLPVGRYRVAFVHERRRLGAAPVDVEIPAHGEVTLEIVMTPAPRRPVRRSTGPKKR